MRRRDFVRGVGVSAAVSGLGVARSTTAADGAPETTKLTIARDPSICPAPMYIAEELLKTEGFVDVRYLPSRRSCARRRLAA